MKNYSKISPQKQLLIQALRVTQIILIILRLNRTNLTYRLIQLTPSLHSLLPPLFPNQPIPTAHFLLILIFPHHGRFSLHLSDLILISKWSVVFLYVLLCVHFHQTVLIPVVNVLIFILDVSDYLGLLSDYWHVFELLWLFCGIAGFGF